MSNETKTDDDDKTNSTSSSSSSSRLKSILQTPEESFDVILNLLDRGIIQFSDVESAINLHDKKTQKRNDSTTNQQPTTTTTNSVSSKNKKNNNKSSKKNNDDDITKNASKQAALFSKCRTRKVAMQVAYDGSNYNGYAENIGSSKDNSVEKQLFIALTKTCLIESRESCKYSRCGRTDKGVSAFGQIIGLEVRSKIPKDAKLANDSGGDGDDSDVGEGDLPKNSFDTVSIWKEMNHKKKKNKKNSNNTKEETNDNDNDDNHPNKRPKIDTSNQTPPTTPSTRQAVTMNEMDYPRILNAVLPPAIRIIGWAPVTDAFNARFSARERMYRYFFVPRSLDKHEMQLGLNRIVGQKRDFRNLCKMDCTAVSNFERLVTEAQIISPPQQQQQQQEEEEEHQDGSLQVCHFQIRGQAFLWHMVRNLVAVSFLIGKKLEGPQIFDELLDIQQTPGKPSYNMAPDAPLVLHKCSFDNLSITHSCRNLWEVTCHWEQQWEDLMLAASRIRNMIDSLKEEAVVGVADLVGFMKEESKVRNKKNKNRQPQDDEEIQLMEERLKRFITEQRNQDSMTTFSNDLDNTTTTIQTDNNTPSLPTTISWEKGLQSLKQTSSSSDESNNNNMLIPSPEYAMCNRKQQPMHHVKLMERGMGSTYTEKITNMKGKKRDKYLENQQKGLNNTKEEDEDFYVFTAKQGNVV